MKWQKTANPFYTSRAWRQAREAALRRDHYMCVRCMERFRRGGCRPRKATMVHHIAPLEERPDLALELSNLESLCDICHNQEHPEKGRKGSGTGGGKEAAPVVRSNTRVIKI